MTFVHPKQQSYGWPSSYSMRPQQSIGLVRNAFARLLGRSTTHPKPQSYHWPAFDAPRPKRQLGFLENIFSKTLEDTFLRSRPRPTYSSPPRAPPVYTINSDLVG